MKLFPEQNGNLMNPLHTSSSSSSLQSTALQQAAAIIPALNNQVKSLDAMFNLNPSLNSSSNSSLTTINNSSNYPLEMECDPVSNASLSSSISLNTTNASPPMISVYSKFKQTNDSHNPHNPLSPFGLFNNPALTSLNTLGGPPSIFKTVRGGGGGSGGGGVPIGAVSGSNSTTAHSLSGNHGHSHRNSKSASNIVHNFAPTSLPIGVYSGMSNNSSSGGSVGAVNSDTHSLAAYQHHLLTGGGVGPNGNITYIPYSMSSETVPKNSSTMTSSSSLSSS